jgi:hypothetical protein
MRPRRHGLPYTTEEEAEMLAAHQRCLKSGNFWNEEMDELAAKLERKPRAVQMRCGVLEATLRWGAKKHE